MGEGGAIGRWARALRGHERGFARAYLLGLALLVAAWLVPAVRAATSTQLKRASYRAEQRWLERVATARDWVEEGNWPAAERALLRLDAELPAHHVKHGLSLERGQVLADLARTHAALGRKRRSLETVRRLVAFEPRNYGHHVLHGSLADRFAETGEAVRAWQRVLEIHPNHLPTVRALVTHHADAGDAESAVGVFETYLDAFGTTPVRRGPDTLVQALPVDGRWHAFDAWVPDVDERGDGATALPVAVETLSEVADLQVVPSWQAGRSQPAVDGPGRWRGRIRAFKPVDAALWATVERSCRNLLAFERLAALAERTRVSEDPGEGLGRDPELQS